MLRHELTSSLQSPANTRGAVVGDEASPRAMQHTCPSGSHGPGGRGPSPAWGTCVVLGCRGLGNRLMSRWVNIAPGPGPLTLPGAPAVLRVPPAPRSCPSMKKHIPAAPSSLQGSPAIQTPTTVNTDRAHTLRGAGSCRWALGNRSNSNTVETAVFHKHGLCDVCRRGLCHEALKRCSQLSGY